MPGNAMLLNILATGIYHARGKNHQNHKVDYALVATFLQAVLPDLDSDGVTTHNEPRMGFSRSDPGSCTNRPHIFKNLGSEVCGRSRYLADLDTSHLISSHKTCFAQIYHVRGLFGVTLVPQKIVIREMA